MIIDTRTAINGYNHSTLGWMTGGLMDRDGARNLYLKVASLLGGRLGPVCIDPASERVFEGAIYQALVDDRVEASDRRVWVPTPWHAFFLMHLNIRLAGKQDKNFPIYRGQRDSNYSLTTTLERSETPELDSRVLRRFCTLVKAGLGPGYIPEVSNDACVAAARHYGIPTMLLDFTPDPAVALFFACHQSSAPLATVFQLPLLPALDSGAKILFPPPFTRRLYLQRGIFIDFAAPASSLLRGNCCRIEFPPDPDFRVVRGGVEVELLGDCTPAETFLAEARRIAILCETGEHSAPGRDQAGVTGLTIEPPGPPDLDEWIDLVSELLYWTAIAPATGEQRCHPQELGHIVRNNGPLMRCFAGQCLVSAGELEKVGEAEKAASHGRLANLVLDQFSQA